MGHSPLTFDLDSMSLALLPDAIICKDLSGKILQWNANAERVFGFRPDEVVGRSIHTIIPPDRYDEEDMIMARLASGARLDALETLRVAKDGSLRRVAVSISPVVDGHGKVVAGIKFARDITRSPSTSDEALVLRAREAEHRTKNILATVMAMTRLSQGSSVGQLKDVISGRIRALSDVASLMDSSSNGAELKRILSGEFWSLKRETTPRVSLNGPPVFLDADQAQAVAMIAHELVTNSLKYGALSDAQGRLAVGWSCERGELRLEWTETAVTAVAAPSKEGFGSRLIRSLVEQSLKGRVVFSWSSGMGLRLKLSFKVAPK
jgi:PAS domain S-box-containing protein